MASPAETFVEWECFHSNGTVDLLHYGELVASFTPYGALDLAAKLRNGAIEADVERERTRTK